ncbi:MAG: hypothetical protein ABIS50_23625 [Luteolibacter sp.]|uniref:hypothetical protein n=1 Tax=Luteolibacter sp. TaxID=1962973 RepID=UPI0032631EAA
MTSPSLKPLPKTYDSDAEILPFRPLDSADCLPAIPLLPRKRHSVLDANRMVVSGSLMRRIEYELKHDECDARTVFSSCRGLARGTREFEDAYIGARIRSFNKHQRYSIGPLLGKQPPVDAQPMALSPTATGEQWPPPSHPLAVTHLGDLMSHFGIWVIALLGVQAWAAWRLGAFADVYLVGGRFFYLAVGLFLMLALDSAVWFRRRGNLFDAFMIPGALLFAMALLPIVALHLREVLLAIK